ncbi:MAG: hypothetical protein JKY48_01610 [Flavobacteriales bacterium]|nr:hypothetical protein [Flavobacteriales bacterium]
MKKLLLTALFAMVSIAFVTAQNYYVAVLNYTSATYEVGIEVADPTGDCIQTGEGYEEIYPSFSGGAQFILVSPIGGASLAGSQLVYGGAGATCGGENGAFDSNGCLNIGQATGYANCLPSPGNYSLGIGSIAGITISGAPGIVIGIITIYS